MRLSDEKEKELQQKRFIRKRVSICVIITLIFFLGFAAKLFMWQVVEGSDYSKIADESTSYTVTTDSTRGEILDCKGVGLAVNRTGYQVAFDRLFLDISKLDDTIISLTELMETRGEKWIDILPITLKDGKYEFRKHSADEIKTLKSKDFLDLKNSDTAAKCVKLLADRYDITHIKDKEKLRKLESVYYNMERTYFSNTNPYIFAKNISSDMVAVISEHMQGVGGVEIQTYLTRFNPSGSLAPHMIGALGSINAEEYEAKTAEGKDYGYNDTIGKFGVELAFEDELKGVGGTRIVQKNSDGQVTKIVQSAAAQPGRTIYLTIDSDIQRATVNSLKKNISAARANGLASYGTGNGEDCFTGGAVMLSVKDFSTLAAASWPTYDLNKYSEYGDYYVKLATDKKAPMYDRAFVGSFAPGSVFKPCVAAAALEEKIISPSTEISCSKYYNYYPTNPVACMGTHGPINMNSAVTQSCNYFFAETGRLLGIDTMYLYAEKFGLGEKTGVEIDEGTGILAGRDSTSWMEGNTVQAAIGQSDNAFTPLQLASYVATIANNGTRLRTHIVKEMRNYERTETVYKYDSKNPEVLNKVGVSQYNLKAVQEAMRNVVASPSGTANYVFGSYKVAVAAKTGTAENAGSDHTVFICYAPYEKPEVAVAVVLEHGAFGRYSMGVAKDMLDAYFKSKKTQ